MTPEEVAQDPTKPRAERRLAARVYAKLLTRAVLLSYEPGELSPEQRAVIRDREHRGAKAYFRCAEPQEVRRAPAPRPRRTPFHLSDKARKVAQKCRGAR